ncbi:MAG: hypothetical protein IJN83_02535, partial [Clostridia bacterium]|nr:hypothetical protein [Clostridia bacterium]
CIQQQNKPPNGGLFNLVHPQGLPASPGQCRRQPGALKNHSQDGFSPPLPPAAPFEPLRVFYKSKTNHQTVVCFIWYTLRGSNPGHPDQKL